MFEESKIHVLMDQLDFIDDEFGDTFNRAGSGLYMDLIDQLVLEIYDQSGSYGIMLILAMLKLKKYPLIESKDWILISRKFTATVMSMQNDEKARLVELAQEFIDLKDDGDALVFKLMWM